MGSTKSKTPAVNEDDEDLDLQFALVSYQVVELIKSGGRETVEASLPSMQADNDHLQCCNVSLNHLRFLLYYRLVSIRYCLISQWLLWKYP